MLQTPASSGYYRHPNGGLQGSGTFNLSQPSPSPGPYQQQQQQQQHYQPPSQAFSTPGHHASAGAGDGVKLAMPTPPSQTSFTSAPYNQTVPAAVAQQDYRHSASPVHRQSPHADQPTPPKQYPMAAPPIPGTPTNNQQTNNAAPSPQTPQSPASQSREQLRINLLFEINVELLQEVNRLQSEGQGGAISPQQIMQLRNEGKPDKMASEEYIQCLRRVQANLAYLMPKAQTDPNNQAKAPPGPAHMTPPPHMAQLLGKYEQLRELFPGWAGMDHRMSGTSASPKPNGPNATNGMTSAPASAQA